MNDSLNFIKQTKTRVSNYSRISIENGSALDKASNTKQSKTIDRTRQIDARHSPLNLCSGARQLAFNKEEPTLLGSADTASTRITQGLEVKIYNMIA